MPCLPHPSLSAPDTCVETCRHKKIPRAQGPVWNRHFKPIYRRFTKQNISSQCLTGSPSSLVRSEPSLRGSPGMRGRNPRQGKRKKRSTSEGEVREGKIIRLELSRKKKEVGECKATPLLGTRCETQRSQQLKIQCFVCTKHETLRPKGRQGGHRSSHAQQAMHTP